MQPKPEYPLQIFLLSSELCLKSFSLNMMHREHPCITYLIVTARSSGILKEKQKLGRTFNSNKLGGIAFTKISKLTMCSA